MGAVGKPSKFKANTETIQHPDAVHALRFRYADVLQALMKVTLQSKKPDKPAEATGLLKSMETFDFVMITAGQDFGESKYSVTVTAEEGCGSFSSNTLTQLRGQFKDIKDTAQSLAASWGITCNFTRMNDA